MPGDGKTLLQPLWIEDLVTCLTLSLDDPSTICNQTYSVGGPEYLTFRQVILISSWLHRIPTAGSFHFTGLSAYLDVYLENSFENFPFPIFWQDYLAADRTCELDTLPRLFGLMPSRFKRQLDYLTHQAEDSLKVAAIS